MFAIMNKISRLKSKANPLFIVIFIVLTSCANRKQKVDFTSYVIIPTVLTENCDSYKCFEIKPEVSLNYLKFSLYDR